MVTAVRIFNTLTKKVEFFEPIDPANVRMYVCGPTTYSRPHIGNMRSVVVYDLLFRVLQTLYKKVTYVRNITDVDDKVINKAKESGVSFGEVSKKYENEFAQDCEALNCLKPTLQPKATENIAQMQQLISRLIENGFAYFSDGHVLFNVKKYQKYGSLSKRSTEEMIAGARIEIASYKQSDMDFVLWKPSKPSSKNDNCGWESPWGYGRPGWHIECSAMSTAILGENFDIHGGGIDLQFPHHENEIAQSVCANSGSFYAKYWVHNGFLLLEGEKMSKSLGNVVDVSSLMDSGWNGCEIRLALLSAHYAKPLNFTEATLQQCRQFLQKAQLALQGFHDNSGTAEPSFPENPFSNGALNSEALRQLLGQPLFKKALEALYNNLNFSVFLAVLHEIIKEIESAHGKDPKKQLQNSLLSLMQLCGIENALRVNCGPIEVQDKKNPLSSIDVGDEMYNKALELAKLRQAAKLSKNFHLADKYRQEILSAGFSIKDLPNNDFELQYHNP